MSKQSVCERIVEMTANKGYVTLYVAAVPITPDAEMDANDLIMKGVYSMTVEAGLPEPEMASVALDLFHSGTPLNVLDDFELYVIDAATGKVLDEDENHVPYSKIKLGCCDRFMGKILPHIYSIAVRAIGDDKQVINLGCARFADINKDAARSKAMDLFWDSRLDSASCRADFEIEQLL